MIVRTAHMANGDVFEVPADSVIGCFERGYVYGADAYGQHVLNVAQILYFGPREEAVWMKEGCE